MPIEPPTIDQQPVNQAQTQASQPLFYLVYDPNTPSIDTEIGTLTFPVLMPIPNIPFWRSPEGVEAQRRLQSTVYAINELNN